MNKLYGLIILLFISACARTLFISVPVSEIQSYTGLSIPYFDCIDCPNKYENLLKDRFSLQKSRVQWHPFSNEQLTDSVYLYTIHNTLKSIGYQSLVSKDFYVSTYEAMVDSMLVWELKEFDTLNYYSKFWNRRKLQGNAYLLQKILKEVEEIYKQKPVQIEEEYISDGLREKLLRDKQMVLNQIDDKKKFYLELFDYLKQKKQYSEAYVLLYRPIDFETLGYDKMELLQTLPLESVRSGFYPTDDSRAILGAFDKKGNWDDELIKWKDYEGP